jgi:hypothetical protein
MICVDFVQVLLPAVHKHHIACATIEHFGQGLLYTLDHVFRASLGHRLVHQRYDLVLQVSMLQKTFRFLDVKNSVLEEVQHHGRCEWRLQRTESNKRLLARLLLIRLFRERLPLID